MVIYVQAVVKFVLKLCRQRLRARHRVGPNRESAAPLLQPALRELNLAYNIISLPLSLGCLDVRMNRSEAV
jgi:hypothetical protein